MDDTKFMMLGYNPYDVINDFFFDLAQHLCYLFLWIHGISYIEKFALYTVPVYMCTIYEDT